ncbi:MAG: IS5 family transposase [Coriobacteriales bacterium]|nr:IS5 family transposase [Coriobacteriales bacterium]
MAHGQTTFSDMEYAKRRKKTRREEFLDMMDHVLCWDELVAVIKPYCYDAKRGRPPRGIEVMLRMYLLQAWFNLSDEAVEDAICDSYAFRKFMGMDFAVEQAPDATTLCKFRHIMEAHNIGKAIFDSIASFLEDNGRMMRGGTIVDAAIIDAPSSTKNAAKARDPEMHQARKGNEWYFGTKRHSGADAATGYVHTITATAANVADIDEAASLVREDDHTVWADAGYVGMEKRDEVRGDGHLRDMDWRVNRRRPKVAREYPEGPSRDFEKMLEKEKPRARSKVEHPFHIVKDIFGFRKARYRGIQKNLDRLHMLFASANIYMLGCAMRLEEEARSRKRPLAQACP